MLRSCLLEPRAQAVKRKPLPDDGLETSTADESPRMLRDQDSESLMVSDEGKDLLHVLDVRHLVQTTEDSAGEVTCLLVVGLKRAEELTYRVGQNLVRGCRSRRNEMGGRSGENLICDPRLELRARTGAGDVRSEVFSYCG